MKVYVDPNDLDKIQKVELENPIIHYWDEGKKIALLGREEEPVDTVDISSLEQKNLEQ